MGNSSKKGYVYVLRSLKDLRTYTGSTDSLEKRLIQHKKGMVKSTKNRLPIELIYSKECDSLQEARRIERYYKNCSGRKKLREILRNK